MNKKKPAEQEVECVWANVWTSQGKMLKGETKTLPSDEVDDLGKAVKAVK